MSSIGRSPLVVTLMLLANVTPVLAQQARHRFWLGGGLGYGAASVSCDTCRGAQRLGGWTAAFEAGATLSPHVRVGAEWREWFNGLKPGGRLPSIQTGTLLVLYYPRGRGGPLFDGGAGLSFYVLGHGTGDPIEPLSRDTIYYSGTGLGFTLGTSWDIPIAGRSSLRPRLAYHHASIGDLRAPDHTLVATRWKHDLVSLEFRFLGR